MDTQRPRLIARQALFPVALLLTVAQLQLPGLPAFAQATSETTVTASCKLNRGEYTCDGALFQKALDDAKTVSIETHSVDKLAQSQLTSLLVKKLAKTIVPDGGPADMIFLLIPTVPAGVQMSPGEKTLGTLQVFAGRPDGASRRDFVG